MKKKEKEREGGKDKERWNKEIDWFWRKIKELYIYNVTLTEIILITSRSVINFSIDCYRYYQCDIFS